MSVRGRFISFEGIDGAGKSSQIQALVTALEAAGHPVLVTREPGGTPLGERLRELLLHQSMHLETEALLMFAARREHLVQVIEPALSRGTWVVSDRFSDASYAYQVGGRGLDVLKFEALEAWVHPGFAPDLCLLFDVPAQLAAERVAAGAQQDRAAPDRFEQENLAFFERVRHAYLTRAKAHAARFAVIDACVDKASVTQAMLEHVRSRGWL